MGRRGITGMACALLLSLAACSERIDLGAQCPAPGTKGSTLARGAGTAVVFGTSCAPCDQAVRYDKRGCPVYVTWASCDGDVCIGSQLIPRPRDAGMISDAGDEDAGDEDAAAPGFDAGRPDGSAQENDDAP